ncbi:hypothetical protein MMC13_006507 [Lambiella insularis]|nr:hypothetical protein [Lambiella insularis]
MVSLKPDVIGSSPESLVETSPDWSNDDFENDIVSVEINEPATTPEELNKPEETSKTTDDVLVFRQDPHCHPIPDYQKHSSAPTTDALVDEGMACKATSLYEGPPKCVCCINWVGKVEEEVERAKVLTNSLHGEAAVLVRHRNGHGGEDPFMMHSITIQSPLLKQVLLKVLKGYPGVSPELEDVTFDAPFEPLFHRFDELLKYGKDETSTETRKHVKVLIDVLEPEFAKSCTTLRECRTHRVIRFDSLWLVFVPGDLVYSVVDGQECVTRLKEATYVDSSPRQHQFELQCEGVDFDGSIFGLCAKTIIIEDFKGTTKTTDLSAMPLELHLDKLAIKERLVKRGKKFEKLQGCNFKAYTGTVSAYEQESGMESQMANISERIIVDALGYNQFTNLQAEELLPLDADGIDGQNRRIKHPRHLQGDNMAYFPPPPPPPMMHGHSNHTFATPKVRHRRQPIQPIQPIRPRMQVIHPPRMNKKRRDEMHKPPLTEDQLILCVPYVQGFLLKRKQWSRFCVEGVEDIQWNEEIFDSLVLPNQEKDLLLAFTEGQANQRSSFDDFVVGKGKGIVTLLSGPAGVGKTLTAEGVAETMRVPLYMMSAGELGNSSWDMECKLKDVLEKCTMWKAVLLIDEADVFLERRMSYDIMRNSMVSVFLRLLEYYEGILFLTTNRVDSLDPAFESRIDVALNYQELSATSRRQIWSNFIMRLPEEERDIDKKDLDALANITLNGRQIKSAVKTAQLLASRKREPLSMDHARSVLELRAHLLRN